MSGVFVPEKIFVVETAKRFIATSCVGFFRCRARYGILSTFLSKKEVVTSPIRHSFKGLVSGVKGTSWLYDHWYAWG